MANNKTTHPAEPHTIGAKFWPDKRDDFEWRRLRRWRRRL